MARFAATFALICLVGAAAAGMNPMPAIPAAIPTAAAGAPAACKTIIELASSLPDYSTLVAAVQQSPAAIALLSGPGPITVFAPNNAAFAAALAALGLTPAQLLAQNDLLTKVLSYHVVDGLITSDKITDGAALTTKAGEPIVAKTTGGVTINQAKVTVPDVLACNGVVHGIDAVLTPPSLNPATATSGRKLL